MAADAQTFRIDDRAERIRTWRNTPGPVVTPSLLNCDFSRMTDELHALASVGVTAVHLDVMDGHFVPNLSYGAPVIASWRKRTQAHFDTHLMISDPGRYLEDFVKAGCDTIIFHIEAVPEPRELLRRIRGFGCLAALSLNPPTPVSAVLPYLDELDSILVMSVMPGFGGQSFDPTSLDKVRALRSAKRDLHISIDGGIKPGTAAAASAAGVNQLVAGSAVFRADGNYGASLAELAEGVRLGLARGDVPAASAGSPTLE